jgi:hypothetical protein
MGASKSRKRGIAGLGALILLIALILAVSVAAMVLLSTTQSLVRKDEQIQKEKYKGIQHPVMVELVKGTDTDDDSRIDRLSFVVRLHWGDDPINLNRTVITVDSGVVNCTSLDYGSDALSGCEYTMVYLREGSEHEEDYMHAGDLIELRYEGSQLQGGAEDLDSTFTFIPSHGMPTLIKVEIPSRIYPPNMQLWPLND